MKNIEKLKKIARDEILAYDNILGEYSCGASLAEHMSPRLFHHKIKFNETMDKLSKIDPDTPTFRL